MPVSTQIFLPVSSLRAIANSSLVFGVCLSDLLSGLLVGLGDADGEAVAVGLGVGLGEVDGEAVEDGVEVGVEVGFAPILTIIPCPSKNVVGAKETFGVTSRVKVRVVFRNKISTSPLCKEVNRSLASKGLNSTALASPNTAAAIALQ